MTEPQLGVSEKGPRVGILNRFNSGSPYLLGVALETIGFDVIRIDLQDLTSRGGGKLAYEGGEVPDFDVLLWRLSENVLPATDRIRFFGLFDRPILQVNRMPAIVLCGDKRQTFAALIAAGIPAVPTLAAFPGNQISAGLVAKPARGAGGRDIIYGGHETSSVPLNTTEAWVVQPDVGDDFIRVLVIDGQAIASYIRIPAEGMRTNNIEAGGQRVFTAPSRDVLDLALAAADVCGADIAGVDIVLPGERTGLAVLELNANPGIPPGMIDAAAVALGPVLRRYA
jgi:glutathione synthase/RimK-type ligase-like ATP-grasp enzyme